MNEKNKKLNKEIIFFLKRRIKDVKSVDQINLDDFHVTEHEEVVDLEKSYQDLQSLKMILQITMNLFNNYELHNNFKLKFCTEDSPLASYYKLDQQKCTWTCFSPPQETDLQDALYNYILCFFSVQKEIEEVNKKKNPKQIQEIMVKCVYCDEDIPSGTNQCLMCDMIQDTAKIINQDKCQEPSIKYISEENNEVKEYGKDGYLTKEDKKELYNNKEMKDKVYMDTFNKWKCGGCGFLNEYTFINCSVCEGMYKDGEWICRECTLKNSCKRDQCYGCNYNNINVEVKENNVEVNERRTWSNKGICGKCGSMKEVSDKDCETCSKKNKDDDVKIRKDEWKCGQCGLLQSFDFIDCGACGESRGVKGVWKCDKCYSVNECRNDCCETCKKNNDYLKDRLIFCSIKNYASYYKDVFFNKFMGNYKDHLDEWQCHYIICKGWNKLGNDFCGECGLYKDHSSNPGAEVLRVEKGWVCYRCNTFNDLKHCKCSKLWCSNPRYG